MKVVIMGCGRVGARVASILDHNGHDVTVIDTDSRAFRRLAGDFSGQTIIGTAIDEDVLVFSPITHAGSIEWNCKTSAGTNVENKYRPSICRD